jgi:hypothetical protein
MGDVRVGLIARDDVTGLGIQTRDFYRHMEPAHVMVVNLSHLSGRPRNGWYPDAASEVRYVPYPDTPTNRVPDRRTKQAIDNMVREVDLVFTCETVYDYYVIRAARKRGVKVVLQYNFELLDHIHDPRLPQPDVFMAPSLWRYEEVPFPNKVFVPVPVDRSAFAPAVWDSPVITKWIHPGGNPVMEDRNGTNAAIEAFNYTRSNARLTVTSPDKSLVIGNRKKVTLKRGLAKEPQDNYTGHEGFIFPRKFGGLCLPLNEAMSLGLPCLMTDLSPQNGFLPSEALVAAPRSHAVYTKTDIDVHSPDVLQIAGVVDRLAEDEELVASLRERTAALGEKISWQNMIPYYNDLFETICSGKIPDQQFSWA